MLKELKHKSSILFIFVNMMVIGFAESMRGLFVPQFKQAFSITDSLIGFMFSLAILGYIISTYLGGILCSKFGQKKVIILSIGLITISYLINSISYNFATLLFAVFLTNIGTGLHGISVNSISPILFITYQAVLINLTHFFYGFGVTISQRFSGIMISKGFTFKQIYLWNTILFLVFFIYSFFIKFPITKTEKTKLSISQTFKNKLVIFFILALGFYVFSEVGFTNWFINFAQTSYNFTINEASYYSSLFFLVFTIGRLTGGFIVEKLGVKKSIVLYLIVSLLFFSSGYLLKYKFTILISLSGFFFSIVFPTTITIIGKTFNENTSYIMGTILAFVSGVNMILNSLMGALSKTLSPYTAFSLIPISLSLSLSFYILIFKSIKKETLK
ncbi:MFS transporter [Tepidibacter formicigenes]|jgi:fucose permease|uniref:Fucose permease n=1 Tax=Tepidibacter formicigenes DSM 15518 TaxID=1123349 RepID=A0A1M6J8K9_9FIRM|nr:MFS transporter [Tepidibacter formicigenes]SHJ42994.1 Fucose permease [Tepidibacter formicigenes DSM 15518]